MTKQFIVRETELSSLPSPKRKLAKELIHLLQCVLENPLIDEIKSPSDVFALSADLVSLPKEYFVVFFLNTKNRVIKRETLSIGSLNATIVHPREVFRAAISYGAASIICVHNHPSGDPTPSQEDIDVTRKLMDCGELIGIEMLDHIIVAKDGWISLRDKGLI